MSLLLTNRGGATSVDEASRRSPRSARPPAPSFVPWGVGQALVWAGVGQHAQQLCEGRMVDVKVRWAPGGRGMESLKKARLMDSLESRKPKSR